jgi:heptosyltransferase-1
VVFLHGTTWDTKHWPEAYWRELAERMGLGVGVKLPWGNPAEKARAERIAQGLNAEVLPKLNLAGVARVLAGAQGLRGGGHRPGHLAAALDVPTISLFGPTNPGLTGAYGKARFTWPATSLRARACRRSAPTTERRGCCVGSTSNASGRCASRA